MESQNEQHTFVLNPEGKIVYLPEVPKAPNQKITDSDDYAWRNKWGSIIQSEWEQYENAVQYAIANGVVVSNQDEVKDRIEISGQIIHNPMFLKNQLFTLNCRVEKELRDNMGLPNTNYYVALVTFPEVKPCTHDALTDTGVGYHYCPTCNASFKQPEQKQETQEAQKELWRRAVDDSADFNDPVDFLMKHYTITRKVK